MKSKLTVEQRAQIRQRIEAALQKRNPALLARLQSIRAQRLALKGAK